MITLKDNNLHNKLVEVFQSRMKAQGVKTGSKDYLRRQVEFFAGVVGAIDVINGQYPDGDSSITPKIYFSLMRGDVITKYEEENATNNPKSDRVHQG